MEPCRVCGTKESPKQAAEEVVICRRCGAVRLTESGTSPWGARPRELELARRYLEAVAQGDPSAYRIGTELAEEVRSAGGAA